MHLYGEKASDNCVLVLNRAIYKYKVTFKNQSWQSVFIAIKNNYIFTISLS